MTAATIPQPRTSESPVLLGLLACPNEPSCGHPALVHDTDQLNQPHPLCCTPGCTCGRPT